MSLQGSDLDEDIYSVRIIKDGPDVGLLKTVDGIFKLVDIPQEVTEVLRVIELNRQSQNVTVLTRHKDSDKTFIDVLNADGI